MKKLIDNKRWVTFFRKLVVLVAIVLFPVTSLSAQATGTTASSSKTVSIYETNEEFDVGPFKLSGVTPWKTELDPGTIFRRTPALRMSNRTLTAVYRLYFKEDGQLEKKESLPLGQIEVVSDDMTGPVFYAFVYGAELSKKELVLKNNLLWSATVIGTDAEQVVELEAVPWTEREALEQFPKALGLDKLTFYELIAKTATHPKQPLVEETQLSIKLEQGQEIEKVILFSADTNQIKDVAVTPSKDGQSVSFKVEPSSYYAVVYKSGAPQTLTSSTTTTSTRSSSQVSINQSPTQTEAGQATKDSEQETEVEDKEEQSPYVPKVRTRRILPKTGERLSLNLVGFGIGLLVLVGLSYRSRGW